MQAITKVFSDIVKPYIDATDNGLINNDFTNGAVNLFPVTATTQTVNGITFTVNSDGTITANGTSTTDFSFSLYGTAGKRLFDTGVLQKGKSYKISGTPSGMPTTVYMYLNTSDGATRDNGDGAIINSTSSTTGGNFAIVVNAANVTLNNVIFKPMITVADMPDSDYAHYVPYAMSNQELTSENQTLKNQIAKSSDEYSSSSAYQVDDYVIYNNVVYRCITACSAAAWSVNQNCFTIDSITNAINRANKADSLTIGSTGCTILVRKKHGVVTLYRDDISDIAVNEKVTIGTLPTGYRPPKTVAIVFSKPGASDWLELTVTADGVVSMRVGLANYSLPFALTYLL